MRTRLAPRFEAFAAVERRDPIGSAVHLGVACAWCVALTLARAPEGVLFALLAGVALVRLHRTWRLYPFPPTRVPAYLLFIVLYAWQALAITWTSNPEPNYVQLLPRTLLLPLALWPLAHRWGTLLAALALGACAHAALLVCSSWDGQRFLHYTGSRRLMTHTYSLSAVLTAGAVVLWAALLRVRHRGMAILCALGVVLCTAALVVLAVRTSLVALSAGCLCCTLVALRCWPERRRRTIGTACAAAAALALATALMPTRVNPAKWWQRVFTSRLAHVEATQRSSERWFRAASGRTPLWAVALDTWEAHPLRGAGSQSWAVECSRRVRADPEMYGVPSKRVEQLARTPSAHSAFLQELAERGLVGLLLLLALLTAVWRGAWRALPSWEGMVALGVLITWCVAAFTQSLSLLGVPLLILGLLIVRASVPVRRVIA